MRVNGEALRELIARTPNVTVPSLARDLDRSHSTIYDLLNDRREASDDLVLAIADHLKVPLPAILADPAEPFRTLLAEVNEGVQQRLDEFERRIRRIEVRLDAHQERLDDTGVTAVSA